jgi:hypothetical protein
MQSLHAIHAHLSGDLLILTVLIIVHEGTSSAASLLAHPRILIHVPLDLPALLVVKLRMISLIIEAICLVAVELGLLLIVTSLKQS